MWHTDSLGTVIGCEYAETVERQKNDGTGMVSDGDVRFSEGFEERFVRISVPESA